MIHSFTFKNFCSFRAETHVSFEVGLHAPDSALFCRANSDLRLSKIIAVIGSNASGKTTVLKSLAFLKWFITDSFAAIKSNDNIGIETHFFSESSVSEFEINFELDSVTYRYQLSVSDELVLHEALYAKTAKQFSYLFKRNWDYQNKSYTIKQQGFGFSAREARTARKNSSLISTAAQYNVSCALKLIDYFKLINSNVTILGREHYEYHDLHNAAKYFSENSNQKAIMEQLMRKLDMGISEIVIEKNELISEEQRINDYYVYVPHVIHRCNEQLIKKDFIHESSGTQRVFVILKQILPTLNSGGVVIIDELESDLHPDMLVFILELFINVETNPKNAQIIFTSHAHEVLNIIDKTQILLVQKDEKGDSEAWRLDEMQGMRRDDNIVAKYRAGAYGAIPNL